MGSGLFGPINSLYDTKKYIIVEITHFTKWVDAATIPNKYANTVLSQIKELIINR